MIRKESGEFVAECNECGAEFCGGVEEEFSDFIEQLKEEGWKMRKEDDEWVHICADCQE